MFLSEKILIVSGILNLTYGCLNGFAYANARMKSEFISRYLHAAHIGALMQGSMLLALVIAFRYAQLSEPLSIASSSLLAISSFFLAAKDTGNWLQSVKDEFSEKPILGKALGAIGVITCIVGMGIILFGVIRTALNS